MPFASHGPIKLCYQTTGPEDGQPMVLIHGLGAQMIAWYPGFVELLHRAGFRVTRFDNRDAGLSTKLANGASYELSDMADDTAALIDHLGTGPVHVVGQSMGGMIAQELAVRHPGHLQSLNLIYTSPSARFIDQSAAVLAILGEAPATDRAGAIRQHIAREYVSGMEGMSREWIETHAAEVVDRDYSPEAAGRQHAATFSWGGVGAALGTITVPSSVIHGRQDPHLNWRGAVAIAASIPNAELHVYADMRHQVPPRLWPDVVAAVARTVNRSHTANDIR